MKTFIKFVFAIAGFISLSQTIYAATDDLIECGRQAVTITSLSKDQAVKLCVNGGSAQSVECARRAIVDLNFSTEQAVELCANKALRLENMVKFVQ